MKPSDATYVILHFDYKNRVNFPLETLCWWTTLPKKSAVTLNILSKNKKIIIKIHCWRDQKMTKLCLVLLSNVFVTVLYASNNWEKSVFFTNLINFLSFKISRKGSALLTELLLKLRKLHIRFRCNWMVVTTVVAQ